MTLDPNVEYLINRGGTSYRMKSSNVVTASQPGDYIFYDAGNGTSKKVEFSNWINVPTDAKLLVNYQGASYYVSGATFRTDTLGGLPVGTRIIKYEIPVNLVGNIDNMANDNISNYGGTRRFSEFDFAKIFCYLTVNGEKYAWSAGDTFSFYTTSPNKAICEVTGDGKTANITPSNWNFTGGEWKTTYTLKTDAMYVGWEVLGNTGTGEIRIHGTRVNGQDAVVQNGVPGVLRNYNRN